MDISIVPFLNIAAVLDAFCLPCKRDGFFSFSETDITSGWMFSPFIPIYRRSNTWNGSNLTATARKLRQKQKKKDGYIRIFIFANNDFRGIKCIEADPFSTVADCVGNGYLGLPCREDWLQPYLCRIRIGGNARTAARRPHYFTATEAHNMLLTVIRKHWLNTTLHKVCQERGIRTTTLLQKTSSAASNANWLTWSITAQETRRKPIYLLILRLFTIPSVLIQVSDGCRLAPMRIFWERSLPPDFCFHSHLGAFLRNTAIHSVFPALFLSIFSGMAQSLYWTSTLIEPITNL